MERRHNTAVLLAGSTLCISTVVLAQTFSIQAVIVSGSSVRSTGGCFRLDATIAEPVAGYGSSADFSLYAGFAALAPVSGNDVIFANGFEECAP